MNKKKYKKKKKIGKVNPILYSIIYAALKHRYTKKYGITFDNSIFKDIKGPAIVVATHTCDVYHGSKLIYIYPQPDLKASVKWVCYLDKLMEVKRAANIAKK